MHSKSYLNVETFCEAYDIGLSTIYVKKSLGEFPLEATVTLSNKLFIDENFFKRRQAFKQQVVMRCHEMYYYLNEFFQDTQIVRMLSKLDSSFTSGSWRTFVGTGLFASERDSVFNYKISGMLWGFYRYCRWIISAIFNHYNVPKFKRNITKILDRKYL